MLPAFVAAGSASAQSREHRRSERTRSRGARSGPSAQEEELNRVTGRLAGWGRVEESQVRVDQARARQELVDGLREMEEALEGAEEADRSRSRLEDQIQVAYRRELAGLLLLVKVCSGERCPKQQLRCPASDAPADRE